VARFCYTWSRADFSWNDNNYTWNDVCIALHIYEGSSGENTTFLDALESLDEPKKKRFIELVCRVKSKESGYEQTYQKRKTINEGVEITSEDVKKTVHDILRVTMIGEYNV